MCISPKLQLDLEVSLVRVFLQGTQTRFHFVPEQSTDFIFCTVGEEWGFLGSVVLVSLFVFLMARIIWMAEKQRSEFTRIYGYCLAFYLIHSFHH